MITLSAGVWANNAELIAACHTLGYVKTEHTVLDATYGRGVWWKVFRPLDLATNDLDPNTDADYAYDFRRFPTFWENTFDAVAFDPPYVSVGGRKTSTIQSQHQRYGMAETPTTPEKLHRTLIAPGMWSCMRVLKPGGVLLQKCQNYISSGQLQPAAHWAYRTGVAAGFVLLDELCYVRPPGRQPTKNLDGSARRQVHSRRNYSTLYVWQKKRR